MHSLASEAARELGFCAPKTAARQIDSELAICYFKKRIAIVQVRYTAKTIKVRCE